MDRIRKRQGFTLMEMLIVVAIIAVLVAIAIPTFTQRLEKSRRAVDLATARDIMAVFAAEVNDGTVELPDPETCIWVEVHTDRIYYGKGTGDNKKGSEYRPIINGTVISDADNQRNTTIAALLRQGGLNPDSIRVKAKDAQNGGWSWYLVYAMGNGTVGVVSGTGTEAYQIITKYPGSDKRALQYYITNPGNLARAMGR